MAADVQLTRNPSGGTNFGQSATDKIALWGATPTTQRASAVQATSNISLTTFMTINTNLAAFCLEVANTLQALGAWKGSA